MANNYTTKYNVDVVMCIDATGSMKPVIDIVKNHALSFYDDLKSKMGEKGKYFDNLRVKVIAFRDYLADGENAMLNTDFYTLPAQSAEFNKVVNSIQPFGGGDDPEDGLEALAYAMKSKWTTGGDKRRHIIIAWSDDATHELGFGSAATNYPKKMAKDFSELTEWWGDGPQQGIMDYHAKRLIVYAPNRPGWSTVAECWDNVFLYASEAGNGLDKLSYTEILSAIANSI